MFYKFYTNAFVNFTNALVNFTKAFVILVGLTFVIPTNVYFECMGWYKWVNKQTIKTNL
jgi:hypothetical protein